SNLGLMVTAEGIEDDETLGFLRKIGCTLVQGYHIARPMPGEDVLPWLLSRAKGDEQRRLDALYALSILDTPSEARFDLMVRLAAKLLKFPIAAFTLVDSERLWFKSRVGIPQPAVLRASSFCQLTIETGELQI